MKNIAICILLIIVFFISASYTYIKGRGEFIKVRNQKFYKGNEKYYFIGTNFWYGAYLGSKASYGNRERLLRELDQLVSLGVKNLRILAASESSDFSNVLKPGIIIEPGKYDEAMLDGLDFLLSEMAKRGMHAVLFLNNYWDWSGGMPQYLVWANSRKAANASGETAKTSRFNRSSSLFYGDTLANKFFREYITMLVNRVNSYTGKLYKEDPSIMAWELANEPRSGEGGKAGAGQFCKWIDESAGFIHSLDKNHLVTTGSEGTVGCNQDSALFLKSHRTINIDYLTFHLWAKNWGWFNAKNIGGTYPSTKTKAIAYMNLQLSLAGQLAKPIVMEEFGLDRDSSKCSIGSSVSARNDYYAMIFDFFLNSALAGGPYAGCNFWAWGGEGRPVNANFVYKYGDPFMGDPPQEGQGLNSVYNTDSSTLKIISQFARKFESMNH